MVPGAAKRNTPNMLDTMSNDQSTPPLPSPSIGKAFLFYAVIPLLLLIFPGLVEEIRGIDYASVLSSTLGTVFGLFPSTSYDNGPLPPQPPSVSTDKSYKNKVNFNIDREMASRCSENNALESNAFQTKQTNQSRISVLFCRSSSF